MKKNWYLWAIGLYLVYLYTRKKKVNGPMQEPAVQDAETTARRLVAEAIDQTNFEPDMTTFKDLYKQDINACR